MGGCDNRCDIGLLGITSSYILQTKQHSPVRFMLLCLGNAIHSSSCKWTENYSAQFLYMNVLVYLLHCVPGIW